MRALFLVALCATPSLDQSPLPDTLGANIRAATCAPCHGRGANRTAFGPRGPVAKASPHQLLTLTLYGKARRLAARPIETRCPLGRCCTPPGRPADRRPTRGLTMISFILNDREISVDAPPGTPLLWVVREDLGVTGCEFGCGIGICGACTVHVEGRAARSCITALGDVAGAHVTTIEGLGGAHPVQQAWGCGARCRNAVPVRRACTSAPHLPASWPKSSGPLGPVSVSPMSIPIRNGE